MRTIPLPILLPILLLGLLRTPATADEPLLRNGAFRDWAQGAPTGWAPEVAAHHVEDPGAPVNRVEPLAGGGIACVGDARVLRWRLWRQAFAPQPGACYRLRYEARAAVRREGAQFDNCWVGVIFKDAEGRRVGFPVQDARSETWRTETLFLRAPEAARTGEVAFFCSLSGRFELRHVALERLAPAESFDVLVAEMDRHYSFFRAHGIDWKALTGEHSAAARAAATPAAFAEAITPMLAALQDPHVWIDVPGAARRQPHDPPVARNFELPQVLAHLGEFRQVIRNVIVGRTKQGFGYLALGTMQGTPQDLQAVDAAWRGLFDAPGIVLDLRVNGGGQETWGQHLLGCLTDAPVHYGRSSLRAGPGHDDFRAGADRWVPPRPEARYRGPVVVLVGPGCISSGEAMAMMAKALPQATLVGLPTRGASGNPQPVHLPNGVTVWYSRWISRLPDGSAFERRGIAPDVRVEHTAGTDAALDRAQAILAQPR